MEELNLFSDLNILAVSDSKENCYSAFQIVAAFKNVLNSPENAFLQARFRGFKINGFFITPNDSNIPKNMEFTDMLIASISPDHERYTELAAYINSRTDIPCKFIISTNQSTETGDLDFKVITDEKQFTTCLEEYLTSLVKLNKVFSELGGSNDSITVTSDNLSQIKSDLGHSENNNNSLYKQIRGLEDFNANGVTTYRSFRRWHFLVGSRENIVAKSFSEICQIEHELMHISKYAEEYFEYLKQHSNSEEGNTLANFTLNPDGESKGVGFCAHLKIGADFDKIIPNLPMLIKENPACLTVELIFKTSDIVDTAISTLNGLYTMFKDSKQIQEIFSHFLSLNFRKSGSSVFVDLVVTNLIGERLIKRLKELGFGNIESSITGEFKAITNLKINELFIDYDLDKALENICTTFFNLKGNYSNVKYLLKAFKDIIQSYEKEPLGIIGYVLGALFSIEKADMSLDYRVSAIKQTVIGLINMKNNNRYNLMCQSVPSDVIEKVDMAKQGFEQVKPMLEPFMEVIKQLTLDHLFVTLNSVPLRTNVKLCMHFPGLTETLEKLFFE